MENVLGEKDCPIREDSKSQKDLQDPAFNILEIENKSI